MHESYFQLGTRVVPWIPVVGLVGTLLTMVYLRRRANVVPLVRPHEAVYVVSVGLLSLLPVPQEWLMAAMLAGTLILTVDAKSSRLSMRTATLFGVLVFVGQACIYPLMGSRYTLDDKAFQVKSPNRAQTIARSELKLSRRTQVAGHAVWFPSGGGWISGSDLYWGPHGIENGDQIGYRLAVWSRS